MQKKQPIPRSLVGGVPRMEAGTYSDGRPIPQLTYLCYKLVLHPNKFSSRHSLFDFGRVFRGPAKKTGVKYRVAGFDSMPEKIREVLFVDTEDFRLYNNAFIARRRVPCKHGFPIADPEIVFKFRHPDMQMAAEADVRPSIEGDYRVKFKCQAPPLKGKTGGIRLLFSHNVQFFRSAIGMERENLRHLDQVPSIGCLEIRPGTTNDHDRRIEATYPHVDSAAFSFCVEF